MVFICTAAGAFLSHQDSWVESFFQDMIAGEPCICVLRGFDATPWRLRFGSMQDMLSPHSRYSLRKKDGTGWELVSAAEFAKRYGGKIGRFGVLEVLAQQLQINCVGRDGICHGMRKLIPPMILQRGNASTIYAAVQRSCPQIAKAQLETLCGKVPCVWMLERPDAHSANQRMRARDLKDREHLKNCYDMPGCCAAHQGHRCVASREPGIIGNLYALAFLGGNGDCQKTFQEALWKIVDEDLNEGWQLASPHPGWRQSNEAMVKHTQLRDVATGDAVIDLSSLIEDTPALKCLFQFLNGDWREGRITHFCSGRDCCLDLNHCKQQVYGALLGVDVTFSDETNMPSVDDWGSCGASASRALFGYGCHRVLPRMVERAFPNYRRTVEVDDNSDGATLYRAKLTKKMNRVKWWVSNREAQSSIIAYGLCGAHIECLIKRLDSIDQDR